jgi:hypothetical protein
MRKYSKSVGAQVIDWEDVLSNLIKDNFAPELVKYYQAASCSWSTCACGQLDEKIPRDMIGEPKNKDLMVAGCIFAQYVENKRYKDALDILYVIQEKGEEILIEL